VDENGWKEQKKRTGAETESDRRNEYWHPHT
jgi:hypothetical protein